MSTFPAWPASDAAARQETDHVQDEAAQGHDQAVLLRHADELVRRHQTARRVSPADQRLEPGQGLAVGLDQRLVENLELLLGQRDPQIRFHFAALADIGIHRRLEKPANPPPIGLRSA